MRYLTVFIILFLAQLNALGIDEWQQIRFSEKTSAGKVYLRTEIDQANINLNKIVHNSGSGNVELDLSLQNAANSTYQALLNSGSGRTYYGLRKQVGNAPTHIVPLRYNGAGLPAVNLLTKVSDDAANDQAVNHQDIIAEYVAMSDTRLMVGLKNRGGGFPTSGGFFGPYYSYMVGIGNPTLDDPYAPGAVAWAFQYVNASGIMTPGFYKITGTSADDVNRIGDITYNIDATNNTLVMSCELSLIYNDPDFVAWYNPEQPSFGLLSLINKISLSLSGITVTQQDNSNGGVVHPVALYVDPETLPFGSIATPSLQIEANDLYFQTQYSKPVDRFEWGLSFRLEADQIYPMSSSDPEYAATRHYRTANLLHSLPEGDNAIGSIWVERIPNVFQQGNAYSYSFVRALNEPDNLQMNIQADQLLLSWQAVSHTPSGTPVQADFYKVEAAAAPDLDFEFLLQTEADSISIPLSVLGDKVFLRVSAQKQLP